jgi:uncharacterized protein CbrC (UPF0167 family)
MPDVLPTFMYHLDPVRNDVVVASDGVCVCCGRARGFLYVGPAFTTSEVVDDNICPWCIADGSAAQKYDVEFADSRSLLKAEYSMKEVDWNVFADGYQPKSYAAFYKFVCRHCGEVQFSWDLD